jgi:hypothetical protein
MSPEPLDDELRRLGLPTSADYEPIKAWVDEKEREIREYAEEQRRKYKYLAHAPLSFLGVRVLGMAYNVMPSIDGQRKIDMYSSAILEWAKHFREKGDVSQQP